MLCASCGHDNREGANFCLNCATPLSLSCSNCGNELPAGARFCDSCATPVTITSTVTTPPLTPPSELLPATVDRILGLLAHTMGKLDAAAAHFEDSLAFCREAGHRPELAWSLCDYSDTLMRRNGEGDRDKAVAMLDESLAISTELGMGLLMGRVRERREGLGA